MNTASLYDPTGQFYDQIPRGLAMLGDPEYLKLHPEHKGLQRAAHLACHALAELVASGKAQIAPGGAIELGEEMTDGSFQGGDHTPWLKGKCRSFVQKGWKTLEDVLGWIDRKRQHGRRTIRILWRLRKSGIAGCLAPATSPSGSPSAPPRTPPEEFKQTTTDGPSSSSHEETRKEALSRDDPSIAELIARACRLVPEVTPGQVATAIGEFTAEWVALALDRVERRNRTPGKKPVTSWGFVLGILRNRQREGWTPPEPQPAVPQPAAVPAPAEPAGPPPLILPAELAELVATARSRRDAGGRLAATQIRMAAVEGRIPPELLATIPGEILAAPEVAAGGSS